jgi:hypothetical protein
MTSKFIFHGFYLLVVAVVSVMFNPHTGTIGFNPDAKTGLIAGGVAAAISFVWATIYHRNGRRIAVVGGLITTGLLLLAFLMRAVPAWINFLQGDTVKWFAATMISLMIFGSLPLLTALAREARAPR